jgi:hypothetical protein
MEIQLPEYLQTHTEYLQSLGIEDRLKVIAFLNDNQDADLELLKDLVRIEHEAS